MNPRTKYPLAAVVLLATVVYAGVQISVNYPEKCATGSPTQKLTGRLSQLQEKLTNPVGEYVLEGEYLVQAKGTLQRCCTEGKKQGMEAKFPVEMRIVKWTFKQPTIRLPEWSDRGMYITNCPSAVAEWDRFAKAIEDHELLHHAFCRGFYMSDLSGYFKDVKEASIPCKENLTQEEVDALKNSLEDQLISICKKIDADGYKKDPTDMQSPPGVWPRVIDGTKDCQ